MEKSGLNPSAALNIRGQARRKLIRFLGTGIATLWVAAHCGLASAQPTPAVADTGTVRISPLQAFNFLTLAQLDGLIDNQVKSAGGRVDWKPAFPAYVPTAEALRGGSIDIGSGSSTSFISAAADDHDLVVFAVERSSGKDQGIVATGASGIKTVADLVGKKVAVNQGGTGEYLLRLALEHNHIPIEKVNVVYLSPTDAATAFAQGQVDAWAVWEQFFAMGQAEPGARVVAYASDIGSLNRNVHVTTRSFAQAHPLLVRAVYDAMRKEADEVQSHPGRVAELNEKAGIPKEVADIIRQVPPSTIVPADDTTLKEFNEIADFYTRSGMATKRIDVNNSLYNVAQQE
ncbi:aliphatic sulfonate ABC transporter substrate-binding protein [Citrobacter sp. JGM124]|uniref:aliphatic sulfonate ABC transporter substrate-binding protein n=1 Tax=Citrobacter sp. JGM124 TaxID=2799789 RepID=UPI001BAE0EA7|nr:aliphatic sulfonate ABC transporter substrate-binding protein [Citrobacter sp. JGM124]MBS0847337.1 aliphatic sulfonate ABC transporter substrate-binding protein [Citrobacter sp. JGM124]